MFHKRFTTIAIAAVIASLLLIGFVVKSDAASITSMSAGVPDDWGDGANVNIYVFTDEGIDFIDWYKDGTYETTTTHNGATTGSVDMSLTGHIKGEKYSIGAVVQFEESSDADANHTFKVYKPEEDTGSVNGVSGSAYVYSITYDGSNINMSGSIYGHNSTNLTRDTHGKFRLTVWENGVQLGDPVEELLPRRALEQNEGHGMSGGPSKFIGPIGLGDRYSANAYARIFVGVLTWRAEGNADFTDDDSP